MDARVSNEVNYSGSSWGRQHAASHWDRPVDVTVENVVRTFGTTPALARRLARYRIRRARCAARTVRLRQDDAAQDSRRPRRSDLRPRAVRRRGRAEAHRAAAECRAGVSELRAVPPYERARQYRLRLARAALGAAAEPQGDPQARARAARSRAALGAREALSLAALRRPAPARGFRHGRSPSSRACSCSTSPSARSTPRCGATFAAGCWRSTTRQDTPRCSSPTTRKRPSSLPTAWW